MPEVNSDTKKVLNGEVIEALSNYLCIEIVLRTNEGDEMVLEMWTVRLTQSNFCETITSVSNIYYRMSIMLKSTLSISRITPAYKLSRLQHRESYQISYKIYGGEPKLHFLGWYNYLMTNCFYLIFFIEYRLVFDENEKRRLRF